MKILKEMILVFVLGLFLVACSSGTGSDNNNPLDADSEPPADLETEAVDLSKLSPQELIKAKYDYFVFSCSLWSLRAGEVLEGQAPTKIKSIDILNNYPNDAGLFFYSDEDGHTSVIGVDIQEIEVLDNHKYTDIEGRTYEMKMSPQVELSYGHTTKIFDGAEFIFEQGNEGRILAVENVENLIFDSKITIPGATNEKYVDRLECGIDAVLKPQYEDHFQKVD